MNTQKVLLGALLAQPDLAPYSLPDLDVEHFAPDVQPVFAAVSGFWNSTGTLDAVQICERYPDLKTAVMVFRRMVGRMRPCNPPQCGEVDTTRLGTGRLDKIPEFGFSGRQQPDHLCRPA